MPNRILKESICTSDTIDGLSLFEETFFYRLIVNCDDYGLMDARAKVLGAKLFPLKNIPEEQIEDALMNIAKAGLVQLYEVNGRRYLKMMTWGDHQRIRAAKSKYPLPDDSNLLTIDSNLLTNDSESLTSAVKCRRNPIQSNPNPNPNPNPTDAAALIDDREAHRILMEHNDILNAADEAGFPGNTATRNILTAELYPKYGKEKLLCGIAECVRHGVPKLAYLAKVLEGKPKPTAPPAKVVLAQQYEQRSYDDEDESFDDIMNSMMKM